jgi:hypothetical protein
MKVALTDRQQEQLRQVRERQLAEWRVGRPQIVDEMFVEQEVVRLKAGMGHAAYLGLDGTVYSVNYGEAIPPEVLADPKDVASCILRWAADIGLPELIEALPSLPPDGEVCSLCQGSRYMPDNFIGTEERRWFFCRKCGGLGWTVQPDQNASPDPAHD